MSSLPHAVLVVDDDNLMRRSIVRELRGPFVAMEASGYSEALSALATTSALEVVIADYSLGVGPNGLAVLAAARKNHPTCTRILVSGEMDASEVEGALRTGLAHLFVPKPWSSGELREALGSLLDLRRHAGCLV